MAESSDRQKLAAAHGTGLGGPVYYVCGGCGAELQGNGSTHSCAGEVVRLRNERDRLRAALERIASLKPRPILDPHNCEERLKRIAREALSGSVSAHREGPKP